MPHILVMHSLGENLHPQELLPALHERLCNFESVKPTTVKTYELPIQTCVVGVESDPADMIHIQVRMKPGRGEEVKKEMAQALHDYTRGFIDGLRVAATVSVEIHELDAPTYTSSHF